MQIRSRDLFDRDRSRGLFESALWVTQYLLLSIGIVGVGWNLFKPGGWLYWFIGMIADHWPMSLYYLVPAVAGLLAATLWLNQLRPAALYYLLTFACAFAGTYFVMRLLLPL